MYTTHASTSKSYLTLPQCPPTPKKENWSYPEASIFVTFDFIFKNFEGGCESSKDEVLLQHSIYHPRQVRHVVIYGITSKADCRFVVIRVFNLWFMMISLFPSLFVSIICFKARSVKHGTFYHGCCCCLPYSS